MIKQERQNQIMEIIKERKYCTVDFLSKHLFVAPITIRRDLTELENAGFVTRCFGGATVPEYENREIPFEVRERQNAAVKDRLAQKAARLIRPGDVVMMDASTTVSHIADYLSEEQDLTVITSSMLVARKLQEKHILCYLTGGRPVETSYALVGSIAEKTVESLYANIFFFSAQGVDENGVISDQSEGEGNLRRVMMKHSQKQYFLFDGSKYGKRFAFKICDVAEVDGFITDREAVDFFNT